MTIAWVLRLPSPESLIKANIMTVGTATIVTTKTLTSMKSMKRKNMIAIPLMSTMRDRNSWKRPKRNEMQKRVTASLNHLKITKNWVQKQSELMIKQVQKNARRIR